MNEATINALSRSAWMNYCEYQKQDNFTIFPEWENLKEQDREKMREIFRNTELPLGKQKWDNCSISWENINEI